MIFHLIGEVLEGRHASRPCFLRAGQWGKAPPGLGKKARKDREARTPPSGKNFEKYFISTVISAILIDWGIFSVL
jgi:hypothetical protein